jgi:hypothetical protein
MSRMAMRVLLTALAIHLPAGGAARLAGTVVLQVPGNGRLTATPVAGGAILRVELTPAPAGVESAAGSARDATGNAPAGAIVRAERLSSRTVRFEVAPRREAGRLLCVLVGRRVECRRPGEAEARAAVERVIADPLVPGGADGADQVREAEKLLAAGDLDTARQRYLGMRRQYATRALADLRLADMMWLQGQSRDAAQAWGVAAQRFSRRVEGQIAALRAASAAANLEGARPAKLPPLVAGVPLAANLALAEARLLGDLDRFEEALELLRMEAPAELAHAADRLTADLLAAGIRLTGLRGEPFRTAVLFRRNFDLVGAHLERVDLQLATADALLDLDLGSEAVEVVNDVLPVARRTAQEERVGAWIERVRAAIDQPVSPAPAAGRAGHPLRARLDRLSGEFAALERRGGIGP